MQCEICGVEIIGSARKVVVEGTELYVCGSCSQYGKTSQGWTPVPRKVAPVATTPKPVIRKTKRRTFDDMDDEIVSDYSKIIREARETKGWTLEELGLNIKEKAALIRKIERSEIKPEDNLRKKLERSLEIKLTERVSHDTREHGTGFQGTTLGDIVKIKRK
ncbi:MAG: TIGR00270 family protein [ANME-2 cluster archaeon]|nr:TIGR00270 family protein [ANME-2 cluster archaeon]